MTISVKSKSKSAIFGKSLAVLLSAGFLATTVLPVSTASAHDRHGGVHGHHHKHKRVHRRGHRHNNSGDLLAAGIIGLTVGAIIGSAHEHRERRARRYEYIERPERVYPEEPIYGGYEEPTRIYPEESYRSRRRSLDEVEAPRVIYNDDTPRVIRHDEGSYSASMEPWTPGWVEYCRGKYRSFNAESGTFMGYDGKRHFCVVK